MIFILQTMPACLDVTDHNCDFNLPASRWFVLSDGQLSELLVFEDQICPTAHHARWHNKIIDEYGGHFLLSQI